MYNYIYNNVVDFNKAINSHWPQSDSGNITIGKDYLSNLPPEILKEIMTHLPLESVQSLHLTNHKISPTTKSVIQFRANIKTQELIESFDIDSSYFKYNYSTEVRKTFKENVQKAKALQNGSNVRVQALRDAVCTIYSENVGLGVFLCSNNFVFNNIEIHDNHLLEQLMKKQVYNYDRCVFLCLDNKINNKIVYLNLLTTNQVNPKELEVRVYDVTFVHEEVIQALIQALSENQSINKVSITWDDCDLVQLDSILETIKNNERIMKFEIRDQGSKRNCCGNEWPWEKSTKEKSYKEFEDLIKNKLSLTFQILESDHHGFFRCERLA